MLTGDARSSRRRRARCGNVATTEAAAQRAAYIARAISRTPFAIGTLDRLRQRTLRHGGCARLAAAGRGLRRRPTRAASTAAASYGLVVRSRSASPHRSVDAMRRGCRRRQPCDGRLHWSASIAATGEMLARLASRTASTRSCAAPTRRRPSPCSTLPSGGHRSTLVSSSGCSRPSRCARGSSPRRLGPDRSRESSRSRASGSSAAGHRVEQQVELPRVWAASTCCVDGRLFVEIDGFACHSSTACVRRAIATRTRRSCSAATGGCASPRVDVLARVGCVVGAHRRCSTAARSAASGISESRRLTCSTGETTRARRCSKRSGARRVADGSWLAKGSTSEQRSDARRLRRC